MSNMSNTSNNNVVSDGTASFAVRDKRLNTLLDILYPIGSIKITVTDTAPFSEYGFGTWEEVSKGRVLWGADDSHAAGDLIEAGLPNITGTFDANTDDGNSGKTGAFYNTGKEFDGANGGQQGGLTGFDASRCSSVYGKSTTVTPPSYVVHFWQRIA